MAAFAQFLRDLFQTGQVTLPVWGQGEMPDFTSARAQELMRERDGMVRLAMAGTAPALDMDAALTGATWLFLACRAFIDRSRPIDYWPELEWKPVDGSPALVYSVDLTLSFLPDLWLQARPQAEDDALMGRLRQLAQAWPLSAVGIPDAAAPWDRFDSWWADRSLRQTYVDRVLARDAGDAIQHPQVVEQLKTALGECGDSLAGAAVQERLAHT